MNSKESMYSWHLSLRVDRPVEVSEAMSAAGGGAEEAVVRGLGVDIIPCFRKLLCRDMNIPAEYYIFSRWELVGRC